MRPQLTAQAAFFIERSVAGLILIFFGARRRACSKRGKAVVRFAGAATGPPEALRRAHMPQVGFASLGLLPGSFGSFPASGRCDPASLDGAQGFERAASGGSRWQNAESRSIRRCRERCACLVGLSLAGDGAAGVVKIQRSDG